MFGSLGGAMLDLNQKKNLKAQIRTYGRMLKRVRYSRRIMYCLLPLPVLMLGLELIRPVISWVGLCGTLVFGLVAILLWNRMRREAEILDGFLRASRRMLHASNRSQFELWAGQFEAHQQTLLKHYKIKRD